VLTEGGVGLDELDETQRSLEASKRDVSEQERSSEGLEGREKDGSNFSSRSRSRVARCQSSLPQPKSQTFSSPESSQQLTFHSFDTNLHDGMFSA